jgi:hypothetical protein
LAEDEPDFGRRLKDEPDGVPAPELELALATLASSAKSPSQLLNLGVLDNAAAPNRPTVGVDVELDGPGRPIERDTAVKK